MRIISAEDIVQIKKAGAEEEGLVRKAAPKQWKAGVTVDELELAQKKLSEFLMAELSRFRNIFRKMDDDHNGWASREEMRTLPIMTGLEHLVRTEVMEVLIDLMDIDGDGRILYKEFVKIFTADDLFEAAEVKRPA